MAEQILISEENVPRNYQSFTEENGVEYFYDVIVYEKADPDEKNIAQVFLRHDSKNKRIGWIIPILSLISDSHDYAENVHFKRYAVELFKRVVNKQYPDSAYFFVISLSNLAVIDSEMKVTNFTHSFVPYGVYPVYSPEYDNGQIVFSTSPVVYDSDHFLKIEDEVKVFFLCDFSGCNGFLKKLTRCICQSELNFYARFMFFYQVVELGMEIVFHGVLNEMRENKTRIGLIRDQVADLSSEKKLINRLYADMGLDNPDADLIAIAERMLPPPKEGSYAQEKKSNLLYGMRNLIVHNYYRRDFEKDLSYVCFVMEQEAFRIMDWLSRGSSHKTVFNRDYVNG